MKHRKRQSTRVWRFPPCPAYDVEATESWLQSMAAQGLHLSEDGFFAGFACFDRGKPKQTRYRLEAAPGAAGKGRTNRRGNSPRPPGGGSRHGAAIFSSMRAISRAAWNCTPTRACRPSR